MDIKVYDNTLEQTKGGRWEAYRTEKMTIQRMIASTSGAVPTRRPIMHYQALNAYADKRLDKCVFGENKPACKQCPVHCYQPASARR